MSSTTIEILGPVLPESIANAEFKEWVVSENSPIVLNQVIAIVESEKVSFEIPAPNSGFITKMYVKSGDSLVSGQVIGLLEVAEVSTSAPETPKNAAVEDMQLAHLSQEQRQNLEGTKQTSAPVSDEKTESKATAKSDDLTAVAKSVLRGKNVQEDLPHANDYTVAAKQANLGPKARRLILEHGAGSAEVESYLKLKLPPRIIANEIKLKKLTDVLQPTKTRVPMTNIRKHIAQRLLESKNSTAMLTTFNEVDLQRIVELRKTYGEAFQKKHGIRLGFMSFFVKAVSEAMKSFPIISACIEGDDIVYSNTTDISIAVSTERGLVTPVLRSTELKTLADIEREIADFAQKANNNKLSIYDMTGGNFTITNGGVFGSLFSTPIINPPQSAILGMHGIKKRPVVVDDQIVIRPMMYIALSYDHRLIDGKDSVRFLAKVKDLLEDPTAILLDL